MYKVSLWTLSDDNTITTLNIELNTKLKGKSVRDLFDFQKYIK